MVEDTCKSYDSYLADHVRFLCYVLFAAGAGLVALAFREMALRFLPDQPLTASFAMGPGAGFVCNAIEGKFFGSGMREKAASPAIRPEIMMQERLA
ncbi:hypothetical protein [uncultured Rhodoblastus sp.]|uniref:hypothetical protein n=1 Tax=uncultured Rhodoblastus sp. TaxID=543037 RepID=UPI0025D7811D|nr:hypothetical protein [uncultured Rhodoblastus sp.]